MYSTLRKIIQGDTPQEHIQAFRSVDKSIQPSTVPLATPEEVIHVDTQFDPETRKDIVLWEDILLAFKNAELVRQKTKVVPFLKGNDFNVYDTSSDMTSTVRRSPIYGLEEAAMENYSHMDKPLAFSSARGPQVALGDQAQLAKDLPVPPRPDGGNHPHLRGPQSRVCDISDFLHSIRHLEVGLTAYHVLLCELAIQFPNVEFSVYSNVPMIPTNVASPLWALSLA
ncbi:MAG: hypothetical protein J3R72DRAFT_424865 [Linnemannia gamsii]|nr:MAG: hypothetical protein J3R72DRAFT_424865 [Linnemannia gamsii]